MTRLNPVSNGQKSKYQLDLTPGVSAAALALSINAVVDVPAAQFGEDLALEHAAGQEIARTPVIRFAVGMTTIKHAEKGGSLT